ncbi:MAG TPA: hypothetical protein VIA10_10925, partial [Gaiellaceae bacterium]
DGCTGAGDPWSCPLTVTIQPSGGGTVVSNDKLIDCGTDCQERYTWVSNPPDVSLTASPAPGWTFAGWGNSPCVAASGATCRVRMSEARSVTAFFSASTYQLTVSVTGSGTVTGSGISCPGDCSQTYNAGTVVQLTESPASGSTFGGWGGDCANSGTGTTCSVTMSAPRTVSAAFNSPRPTLTVSVAGSGKVTGPGIDCPGDCSEQYSQGQTVQLTAAPGTGATFSGWGGNCSGSATTCSLTMSANRTASATFAAGGGAGTTSYSLTVSVGGSGSGTVTGSGISCPGDCTQDYAAGTNVTLTATPTGTAGFSWGGACASAGSAATCTVAMTAALSVSVTFVGVVVDPAGVVPEIGVGRKDPLPPQLPPAVEQVIVKVDGTGRVTSSPARVLAGAGGATSINCGSLGGPPKFDCLGEYRPGQTLTLNAQPGGGYVFKRWTGACAGSGPTCRVSTRDSRTTTAVFEQGGTGSAVAALLRPPNLRVRWLSSIGAGNLVLRGSTSLPATARVDMRRPGGGPLATLKLKLGGGSFRELLALKKGALRGGAKLLPGGFTVALTGRAGRLKLPLQMQTISIPAPTEGVVRRAFKSRAQNGKAVTRFAAGTKRAWANFRFETQPLRNQKLYVRWYFPDGRLVGQVEKSNRPVISSYLALETGLPRGLWVAELRTGKRVIQRLSLRVG